MIRANRFARIALQIARATKFQHDDRPTLPSEKETLYSPHRRNYRLDFYYIISARNQVIKRKGRCESSRSTGTQSRQDRMWTFFRVWSFDLHALYNLSRRLLWAMSTESQRSRPNCRWTKCTEHVSQRISPSKRFKLYIFQTIVSAINHVQIAEPEPPSNYLTIFSFGCLCRIGKGKITDILFTDRDGSGIV